MRGGFANLEPGVQVTTCSKNFLPGSYGPTIANGVDWGGGQIAAFNPARSFFDRTRLDPLPPVVVKKGPALRDGPPRKMSESFPSSRKVLVGTRLVMPVAPFTMSSCSAECGLGGAAGGRGESSTMSPLPG